MTSVRVVSVEDVPPVDLGRGSWSRVLLTGSSVASSTALGYSEFQPGTSTDMLSHSTEEVAYVVAGRGELQLDSGREAFESGSALFVPAGCWHAVSNTGQDVLRMVFAFPAPDYPPTQRRQL